MNNHNLSKEDREIIETIERARPEARRRAANAEIRIKMQIKQALAEAASARAKSAKTHTAAA